MEQLLELALRSVDEAEVYAVEEVLNKIEFENSRLKSIDSSLQSGMSLRIIKDGKIGFAYAKNLFDRNRLVRDALDSLRGGAEAPNGFPGGTVAGVPHAYDPGLETLSNQEIADECLRVCDLIGDHTGEQLNLEAGSTVRRLRILNSRGARLETAFSEYRLVPFLLYPGSYAAITRPFVRKGFEEIPQGLLNYIVETFRAGRREVPARSGKMKVVFLPENLYVLMWRFQAAAGGNALYKGESPLQDRVDEKIFSRTLSIFDDPLNDLFAGARGFDDEGTPCGFLSLVEDGVFKNFYCDLLYAKKLNMGPTGHGYKTAMWGGEMVSLRPTPSLQHLTVGPGASGYSDLIRSVDRGILTGQALGAHSGNIQNGDYSIGLAPGLYIEDGEIVGQVKNAMIAGNIYETLNNVVAVEDELHQVPGGRFPAILVEGVNVAAGAV